MNVYISYTAYPVCILCTHNLYFFIKKFFIVLFSLAYSVRNKFSVVYIREYIVHELEARVANVYGISTYCMHGDVFDDAGS